MIKTMYEALDELEETNSYIDKEDMLINILRTYANAEMFFRLAFNDTVYGIAEKTMYAAYEDLNLVNSENIYEHVSDFLDTIPKAEGSGKELIKVPTFYIFADMISRLSGDEQIQHIRKFFDYLEPIKKKWFSRALLHDLRCGVKVKSINKVFKQLGMKQIEKFALQLAKKLDCYDEDEVNKKVKFPCSMEMKYDGYRIQATLWTTYKDESVEMHCQLMSRRGNDRTDSYPEVVEELKKIFIGQSVILDGEMVASSFQSLTRKDDTSTRKYVIFDILVDETLPYRYRWDNLRSLASEVGITDFRENQKDNIIDNHINSAEHSIHSAEYVFLAEHYSCNNIKEMQEFFDDANIRGEEGIIVKLDDKIYERGSRNNMFKCKKVYTADLKIIGYKFGEGKRAGKVATLELIDKSETIRVDVGSGITDDDCEELTNQVEETMTGGGVETDIPFIGQICEILYNEKTETGSLRFPRFVKIRDDKDEEDDLS